MSKALKLEINVLNNKVIETEEIYHLIDLLEINMKLSKCSMPEEEKVISIDYDKALIEKLEGML